MKYFARQNEVWRKEDDEIEHLAVVVRPIDGSLNAETRELAKLCAVAMNCGSELLPKLKEMLQEVIQMRERGQDRLSAVDLRRED